MGIRIGIVGAGTTVAIADRHVEGFLAQAGRCTVTAVCSRTLEGCRRLCIRHGLDGGRMTTRLEELLDVLGLRGREKYLPNQLSGGQQQRVSIGRALMNAPAVVLADEPTGNLDSKNSQEIVELLKMSNKKYGQTLVIITHDENIALQAHRVIAIEDGRITRDERIREVLE